MSEDVDNLPAFAPSHRQRTETIALAFAHIRRAPGYEGQFLEFCRERYGAGDWPQVLIALLDQVAADGPR